MNSVIVVQIILVVSIILIIGLLLKIYKAIQLDRRISLYSLKIDKYEDVSYADKIWDRYVNFISRLKDNKILMKISSKYEKYISVGDDIHAIQFIINKLVIACCFVILVIISYTLQSKMVSFISFIFSFIVGYYLYDIYLVINKRRRKVKIKNDMLRAVIIMNNAFKAGKSTLQAVEIASCDLPMPISLEFKKIYQDMSYGLSADVAFSRFAKRVGLEEANYIASSLTILSKTGGNIIMVFSSIERTLFDKKKLESDLKNSSAASNLVVKVLMVIPILFVLVIYIMSPNYFEPLFASSLGYFILFIIWLMFVSYIYLLNKIMKVRV